MKLINSLVLSLLVVCTAFTSTSDSQSIYIPHVEVYGGQLDVSFAHETGSLKRVIDVNNSAGETRYIVRYAPSISNSENSVTNVQGSNNGVNYSIHDAISLSSYSYGSHFEVEVYDQPINYSEPMTLDAPKGKGGATYNDPDRTGGGEDGGESLSGQTGDQN